MATRTRNTILFFLQDEAVREVILESARRGGWDVFGTASFDEALKVFGACGERLAVVVTDDMTGPDEGKRRGMRGIDFLQQRSTHMFNANIPFVLLMFTASQHIQEWANGVGGWMVTMPGRMSALLELFDKLEHDHQIPPKPQPRTGER